MKPISISHQYPFLFRGNAARIWVFRIARRRKFARQMDADFFFPFYRSFVFQAWRISEAYPSPVHPSRSQEGTRESEPRALGVSVRGERGRGSGRASPSTRIREFIASVARCTPGPIRELRLATAGTSPPGIASCPSVLRPPRRDIRLSTSITRRPWRLQRARSCRSYRSMVSQTFLNLSLGVLKP